MRRWKSELTDAGHTTIFTHCDGKHRKGNGDSTFCPVQQESACLGGEAFLGGSLEVLQPAPKLHAITSRYF